MQKPNKKTDDKIPDEEARKRRDEALRKALATPPKPHDSKVKSKESQSK